MAEREVKQTAAAVAEDDDSSASEYEEIIEEVTDYSDSDEEEAVTAKEQTPSVSSPEPTKVQAKKSTNATATTVAKVTETSSKKATATATATATSSTERQTTTAKKAVATSSTTVAASKQTKAVEVSSTTATSSQSIEQKASVDQTDSKVVEHGESRKTAAQPTTTASKPLAKTKAKQTSSNINTSSDSSVPIRPARKAQTVKNGTKSKQIIDNRTVVAGSKGSKGSSSVVSSSSTSPKPPSSSPKPPSSQPVVVLAAEEDEDFEEATETPLTSTETEEIVGLEVTQDNQTVTDSQTATDTQTVTDTPTQTANMPNANESQSNTKQVDRLSVPPKEDSGTESGEDLRLLAAGLRDKLHMQSDSDLIVEVTKALSRLECSLKEGKEISVEPCKRQTLLALVERLQTGLTSPEKLAEIAQATADLEMNEETSSPEADAHRTSRQRFANRRKRNNRHTVGVSREELADARRYMEDMLMMESISNCTTPDSNSAAPVTPPNWFPLEKNASTGTMLLAQQPSSQLYRPNEFVPSNLKSSTECLNPTSAQSGRNGNRRPLSGDFGVSFDAKAYEQENPQVTAEETMPKNGRFNGSKKQIMKRANTIDFAKTKKYNSEFETDSEAEDKGPKLGLKRAVQVTVKKKVQSVVPPFEPKTENDHKFLAFINKQSPKPGLGWNSSRSVSNWTNKFGNLKHTFEVGEAATSTKGKPPQPPGRAPTNAAKSYWNKQSTVDYSSDDQRSLRAQQERNMERERMERERMERERLERQRLEHECYEREAMERKRMEYERQRMEQERMERERVEREFYEREYREREQRERRDMQERERMERERMERERMEREHMERDRMERERIEREILDRQRLERERMENERLQREHMEHERLEHERRELARIEREQLAKQRQQQSSRNPLKHQQSLPSAPPVVNQFQHAPQSVFRPIENYSEPAKQVYKPIAQKSKQNTWQPTQQYLAKPGNTTAPYVNSPSPTATSPIGLPWLSKPTIDNSIFRSRAHRFEERSREDERNPSTQVKRHSSLRGARDQQQFLQQQQEQQQHPRYPDFNKRPSLPNTADPYSPFAGTTPSMPAYKQQPQHYASASYLATTQTQPQVPPPPMNISFSYADLTPRSNNYLSQPCLPTAVTQEARSREDSLTNPQAMPLILTSSNPSYEPLTEPRPYDEPMSEPAHSYMQVPQKRFDYVSPLDSAATSPSFMTAAQTDLTDDDVDSDNLLEYRVESKVMRRPEGQTAVTVSGRRTNHMSDDEVFGKNSRAAKSLLHTMRNLGGSGSLGASEHKSRAPMKKQSESPKLCLSPDGRSYQAPLVEPLFPQLSTFKASRAPVYAKDKVESQLPSVKYQQIPPYSGSSYSAPVQPTTTAAPVFMPMQSAPQPTYKAATSAASSHTYRPAPEPAPYSQPLPSTQPSVQHPVPPPVQPYVSETQTSYVVTYPADDSADERDSYHHSKSTQQERSRYTSENSTSSSISTGTAANINNVPSPRTSWHTNPLHGDDGAITAAWKDPTRPMEDIIRNERLQQQQRQAEQLKRVEQQRQAEQLKRVEQQQQQQAAQLKRAEQLQQQAAQVKRTEPQQPKKPDLAPKPQFTNVPAVPGSIRPKLNTRSHTITGSQHPYDAAPSYQAPLQQHNRVLSQQTLVSNSSSTTSTTKQQHFVPQPQPLDVRRKSLGNVQETQQRRSSYTESQHASSTTTTSSYTQSQYKSSAPADTPDIVKSSLPKDENQPILKKFGPPQRHHYVPNSYQSPNVGGSTTTSSSTKVTTTSQHQQRSSEIVQHSTHTAKPFIVETPATPQPTEDQIPRNIVFNNINAFAAMSRRNADADSDYHGSRAPPINRLSKSDSWNQICQSTQQIASTTSTTKFNAVPQSNELRRTKSGHTLGIPKMFEAGMSQSEVTEKQRTVAAYFAANKSPNSLESEVTATATKRSAINRTKTSEKTSACRKSMTSSTTNGVVLANGGAGNGGNGLARSATMPHIGNLNLLDESNVEDAFEQLMMGS